MPSTPINIAGIVLDHAGFQPLAGAEIRETKSRQRLFTDAKGFYSLQLSAASDKPAFQLKLYWQGKLVTSHGVSLLESYEPQGWIQIDIVDIQTGELADAMLHSPEFPNSPNPGYEQAQAAAQQAIKDAEETLRFRAMEKAHPGISLFYVVHGGQRRLVIYRDGRVEGYGGPEEPDLATMDSRYAPLPWYMVHMYRNHPKRSSPWEEVARRLQQDFHPLPTDAKAIVFPGDDHVIVVNASGEAEIYHLLDIESTPNRRSEFEARFGPLPDYIPVAVRQGTDSYAIVFPERNVEAGGSRQMMHVQHISIIDIESDHTK